MLPDDPGDQARLFYLVLLLMAVAVWAVQHYRDRMGQALQHAAIWALIFLGVILAVGFAEPLKQTLFGDEARQVDERTVELRRARDGHFYATVQVNGHDLRFMIDTGATSIVLTRADAEAVGINTAGLSFVVPSATANGRVMSAPVRLESMRLGRFTDHGVRASVNGGELGQSLLGMSYLDRFTSFRAEGDRFYLSR